MTGDAHRVVGKVLGWQVLFSLIAGVLVGALAPYLILLTGAVALHGPLAVGLGIWAGSAGGTLRTWLKLRRYQYLLRGLTLSSASIDRREVVRLTEEPARTTFRWLVWTCVGLGLCTVAWRPGVIDLTTGITLFLLGVVLVATASLPLFVLVRRAVVRAIELVPPEVMREVLLTAEKSGLMRQRMSRRLMAALVTPVLFIALGSALVTNAHLRRADELNREESARMFARTALERTPGALWSGGLSEAIARAEELGYRGRIQSTSVEYSIKRGEDGMVIMSTPLDQGGALVTFSGSTVGVLTLEMVAIAVIAATIAAFLGILLGRGLHSDLFNASRRLQVLGTDTVMSGGTLFAEPARFRVVSRLGSAIESLAERFRVFFEAQVRAIGAREGAARMRGLFFASVSHDLKSPLNAILGFTDLVRQRAAVSVGQAESLALIDQRGRELLALIETILDAARVEAGQLTLIKDYQPINQLLNDAIDKGKDLAGGASTAVACEIANDVPEVCVDLVRMPRALATMIGYALRTSKQPFVHIRADARKDEVRIEIEVPGRGFSTRQLEAILDPARQPGAGEHRGMALGLHLARAVIELHEGSVRVERRGPEGVSFRVRLPRSPSTDTLLAS